MHHPVYLTRVPKPNTVIGREAQLKTIYKRLTESDAPLVLVNGLGGIGKTTVALEYIRLYAHHYRHIAWVEVTDTIAAAFASNTDLIENLQLTETIHALPTDNFEARVFECILNQLNQRDHCLLVLDNANRLDDLQHCRHRLGSLRNTTTLLTSRAHPQEWNVVKIEELSRKDAFLLFTAHYRPETIDTEQVPMAYALLQYLSYHTLLIELIAKAATNARLPLAALYEKVQANYLHDADLNARPIDAGAHADHTRLPQQARIEHYITMVFQEISTLSDTEQRYLRYTTLLPSNDYVESFLEEVFQITADTKYEFLDAMESLAQKGWLTQKQQEQGYTYKVHSLVQEAVVTELGVSYEQCAPVVEYWIESLNVDEHFGTFYDSFPLLPFGNSLKKVLKNEVHERVILLFRIIDVVSSVFNTYQERIKTTIDEIENDMIKSEDDYLKIAGNQASLGLTYFSSGQFEDARISLEKFLPNIIKTLGEADIMTMLCIARLANVYEKFKLLDKAISLHQQNLQVALKTWNENHSQVSSYRTNLGLAYIYSKEYSKAQLLLEQALKSNVSNFGEFDVKIAANYDNLAWAHLKQENWIEAKLLFQKAYIIWLKEFGENHFSIKETQKNIAYVQAQLDKQSEP